MFRRGIIVVTAMLVVAAAPIPKPSISTEHQRSECNPKAQSKPTGADQNAKQLAASTPPKIEAKSDKGRAAPLPDEHYDRKMDLPSWIGIP